MMKTVVSKYLLSVSVVCACLGLEASAISDCLNDTHRRGSKVELEDYEPSFHNYHPQYLEQEALAGRHVDLEALPCRTKSPSHDEMFQMNGAVLSWKSDASNQRRQLATTTYKVPVYLHVIKKNEHVGGLGKTSQKRFIHSLNKGFRDTAFTFVLAGVDVIINPEWHVGQDEAGYKSALRVNGTNVLNVYVLDTNAMSGGQIGFAYYPPVVLTGVSDLDGVVIMNPETEPKVFYPSAIFNGLCHEVGHFLGLAHTFEGGCSADTVDHWHGQDSYQFSGDGVSDTAAHAFPTYGRRKGAKTCYKGMELEGCRGIPGVDHGYEPVDNYMNVIPGHCYDDARFTPGQMERMLIQYETYRL